MRDATIGERVKRSLASVQRLRDVWQGLGREPEKSRAKRHYDEQCSLRGTIQEADNPPIGTAQKVTVLWDTGYIEHTFASSLDRSN